MTDMARLTQLRVLLAALHLYDALDQPLDSTYLSDALWNFDRACESYLLQLSVRLADEARQ